MEHKQKKDYDLWRWK